MAEGGLSFIPAIGPESGKARKRLPRGLGTLVVAVLLLSCSGAGALVAQPLSDPGFGLGGSVRYAPPSNGSSGGFFGQVSGRGRLTGGLGVEGSLAIRQSSYQLQTAPALDLLEACLTASAFVFLFPNSRLQPHPILGGGYHLVWNSGAASGTEHLFAFHAGLGAEYRLKPRTTVIADIRYVFLEADSVRQLTGEKAGYLSIGAGVLMHLR